MSRSSNYKIKRCPTTLTTDCVEVVWVGGDITCLDICNGDTLSEAQVKIVTKICDLAVAIDISTLVIPSCFATAFATGDASILEVLDFVLDTACIQQNEITTIQTDSLTKDSLISITYPDCCSDTCNVGYNLTISQHFERVLECICALSTRVTTLESQVGDINNTAYATFEAAIINLTSKVSNLESNWASNKTKLTNAITCLTTNAVDVNGDSTGCTLTPLT